MVAEVLLKGKDNAQPARSLCNLLGITQRELSQAVERERRAGEPICASCNGYKPGYYLATDKAEMDAYCRSLYHRGGEIMKTRRACLKTIDGLPQKEE